MVAVPMTGLRIVFMGTPLFAVPTLQSLYEAGSQIIGVYTQPPRRQGRGLLPIASPVYTWAQDRCLQVFTPHSLKSEDVQKELSTLKPDFIVVIAYGLIIPRAILEIPRYACVNIHPSRLPRWRGAAPLQRTLLSGDRETAITIIRMDSGIDTGDILYQKECLVPQVDIEEYSLYMAQLGAEALIATLERYTSLSPQAQSTEGVSYAHKICASEGQIDWARSAQEIEQQIRAFLTWPGSWFIWNQKRVKILKARVLPDDSHPGLVWDPKNFIVGCGKGSLQLLSVQVEGGKKMCAKDFVNGYSIVPGTKLSGIEEHFLPSPL